MEPLGLLLCVGPWLPLQMGQRCCADCATCSSSQHFCNNQRRTDRALPLERSLIYTVPLPGGSGLWARGKNKQRVTQCHFSKILIIMDGLCPNLAPDLPQTYRQLYKRSKSILAPIQIWWISPACEKACWLLAIQWGSHLLSCPLIKILLKC